MVMSRHGPGWQGITWAQTYEKEGEKGAIELSHTSVWCLGVTVLVFLTGLKRSLGSLKTAKTLIFARGAC